MYESYVTAEQYHQMYGDSSIPEQDIPAALRDASRHVDSLTYNRIVGQGFHNLTPWQQDVIREVVCRQARFEYENADVISTVLSGYSLNGVSMQFGQSWNVITQAGVAMQRDTYALLQQSGLCWGGV